MNFIILVQLLINLPSDPQALTIIAVPFMNISALTQTSFIFTICSMNEGLLHFIAFVFWTRSP